MDLSASKLAQLGIVEPQKRLQNLCADSKRLRVDDSTPIRRYYFSGDTMVQNADHALRVGDLERAFSLYMRFSTIFVEQIAKHPEYKTVEPKLKRQNQTKVKEILSKAEKIKPKLLERFTAEYEQFLAERRLEEERQQQARQQERKAQPGPSVHPSPPQVPPQQQQPPSPSAPPAAAMPATVTAGMLDHVLYPNDFPTDPARAGNGGLLLPPDTKPALRPAFDRTLKPAEPPAPIVGLRPVLVPANTMARFLQLAATNTAANVETCGILAGRMEPSEFRLTHLIVPKQRGTADSCNTVNEEEIYHYQDNHQLITLGWIHTHPSQTAFLSSVDLHTHCSYQIMLDEAIAIVCSPKYQQTGFFCLTPNHGLEVISQCRLTGFHPHTSSVPLFMEAAHVAIDRSASIEMVDLR